MHAFVATDELVGEGETRHKPALLQPEDSGEGPREEYPFHSGKRHQSFRERRCFVRDPSKRPVRLALDAWDRVDGGEEVLALLRLLDVRVDEERVCLGVDVLPVGDDDEEPVSTTALHSDEHTDRRSRPTSGRVTRRDCDSMMTERRDTYIMIWKP